MEKTFEEKEQSFSSYFIKNFKVAYVFGILILLWGALSALSIPKEAAPNIPFGIVSVNTVYSGASAADIDKLITQEIESKLKSISGVKSINSSSQIGISSIIVEFEPDHNMIVGVSDIRNKIDETKGSLPNEIEQDPIIREISTEAQPFLSILIHGEEDSITLRDFGDKMKREMEAISGVSEVTLHGGAEREIVVDIHPGLLHSYGFSVSDVQSTISSSNQNIPLGDYESNNLEYTLRFESKYESVEEIKNLQVRNLSNQGESSLIQISDIAKVYLAPEDTGSIQRLSLADEEKPHNFTEIRVLKSDKTNIFNVTNKVKQKAQEFADKNFPDGIDIRFARDSAEITQKSFDTVFKSGSSSVLIVLLLILIFVGFKEGVIASIVIPLTFLVTIGITQLLGKTMNFMTNFSMVLALGILVDTAIVVVEGCHDYIRRGKTPYEASILALHEYKGPLISGTLTTLAVFIPLFTLPGVLGKYLSFIPITVSIVLVTALVISLLLVTSYAARFLKPKTEQRKEGFFSNLAHKSRSKFNAGQSRIIKAYARFVNGMMQKRFLRIGMIYLIFILFSASWLIPLKFDLFPQGDAPFMNVVVENAIGTNKEKTAEDSLAVEEIIMAQPEVRLIRNNITGRTASLYTELTPENDRAQLGQRTSEQLVFDLQDEFAKFKNSRVEVRSAAQGPPSESPVAFRIVAKDSNNLEDAERVAKDFTEVLKEIANTSSVKNDIENTPGEVKYTINRDQALALGLNPQTVPFQIRTAIEGSKAATITKDGRDIDVTVKYQDGYTDDLSKIAEIMLSNNQGELIPISEFVNYEIVSGLSNIKRVDTDIAFTVSSGLGENGNAAEITKEFTDKTADYELPEGVTLRVAGENEENAELFQALGSAFVIALMIMFMILVIQFKSYLHPILILSTIIFAMIGVNAGLWLTDTARSLPFILGTIALAGIVVNDAIILVDQINKKIRENDMIEAIVKAGKTRFTPIVLTTLTTTAGIAPLIFVDNFWAGLSYTVIFGLMVASFLTLFVTPAMYYQLEREKAVTFLPILIIILLPMAIFSLISGDLGAGGVMLTISLLAILWFFKAYRKLRAA